MTLKNETIAALINELQAPLVVSDILKGHETLDEADFALSALMSDFKPDAALLAIALSVRTIVQPYLAASPTLQAMYLECGRITEDFADVFLTDALSAQGHAYNAVDILAAVSEDLDYMSDFLDLAHNFFTAKDPVAAALCKIIKGQAQAQSMIAETFSNTIAAAQRVHTQSSCGGAGLFDREISMTNNVVAFQAA